MMRWAWIFMLVWVGCNASQTPVPPPSESLERADDVLRTLKGVQSVQAKAEGFRGTVFEVVSRTHQMTQYPCQACHKSAIGAREQRLRWSHLDVQLIHGQTIGMECQTCHSYNNLQQLQMQDGTDVSFDHSYQVCQQCHFEQARDWAGGAHGKRLASWRGKRVVKSCTGCHNPHKPAFDQRVPFKGPSVPRTSSH